MYNIQPYYLSWSKMTPIKLEFSSRILYGGRGWKAVCLISNTRDKWKPGLSNKANIPNKINQ